MKSIIEIEDGVLERCKLSPGETSVTVPAGVTSIGVGAFDGCVALTSITLPAGVTSIEEEAFLGCVALTSIKPVGETVSRRAFVAWAVGKASEVSRGGVLSLINMRNVLCLIDSLTRSRSMELPASVTSIRRGAFGKCSALTSITLPASVTSIGEDAFIGCVALTSIILPAGVTYIGEDAFYDCVSLTSITLPAGLNWCGRKEFSKDIKEEEVRNILAINSMARILLGETGSRRAFVAWAVGKASEVPRGGVLSLINMRNVLCLIDSLARSRQLVSQVVNSAGPEMSDEPEEKEGLGQRESSCNLS